MAAALSLGLCFLSACAPHRSTPQPLSRGPCEPWSAEAVSGYRVYFWSFRPAHRAWVRIERTASNRFALCAWSSSEGTHVGEVSAKVWSELSHFLERAEFDSLPAQTGDSEVLDGDSFEVSTLRHGDSRTVLLLLPEQSTKETWLLEGALFALDAGGVRPPGY